MSSFFVFDRRHFSGGALCFGMTLPAGGHMAGLYFRVVAGPKISAEKTRRR